MQRSSSRGHTHSILPVLVGVPPAPPDWSHLEMRGLGLGLGLGSDWSHLEMRDRSAMVDRATTASETPDALDAPDASLDRKIEVIRDMEEHQHTEQDTSRHYHIVI